MASVKKITVMERDELLNVILNPNYKINDFYNIVYLTPESYSYISSCLSKLRSLNEFDQRSYYVISRLFKNHYDNYYKIKALESKEPRLIAQKFIGRKKIRNFIFKRDKFICLRCSSTENLQIDHIIPISKGGENKLMNLQTLCRRCNVLKSDNYKDYRNGSR